MNVTKHTPGPWKLHRTDKRAVRSGARLICDCHSINSDDKEVFANARLIAAAPLLAEALEMLFHVVDEPETITTVEYLAAIGTARAALKISNQETT